MLHIIVLFDSSLGSILVQTLSLLKLLQKMISSLALHMLMINKRLAVEQRRAVQTVRVVARVERP